VFALLLLFIYFYLFLFIFISIPLVGAGVYNQTDGEWFILPLGRHTSVFQAEVYALLENLVNSSIPRFISHTVTFTQTSMTETVQ